jgi:hypothetical protein
MNSKLITQRNERITNATATLTLSGKTIVTRRLLHELSSFNATHILAMETKA